MTAALQAPCIHLNGSGRERLLDDYKVAVSALRSAIDTVQDTGPNARDYYPLGGGAYDRARLEHGSRVDRLRDVLRELSELAQAVADAP